MIVATKILSSSIKLCAQPNRASGSSDLMTQTMKLVFVFCLMLIGAVSKVSSAGNTIVDKQSFLRVVFESIRLL